MIILRKKYLNSEDSIQCILALPDEAFIFCGYILQIIMHSYDAVLECLQYEMCM